MGSPVFSLRTALTTLGLLAIIPFSSGPAYCGGGDALPQKSSNSYRGLKWVSEKLKKFIKPATVFGLAMTNPQTVAASQTVGRPAFLQSAPQLFCEANPQSPLLSSMNALIQPFSPLVETLSEVPQSTPSLRKPYRINIVPALESSLYFDPERDWNVQTLADLLKKLPVNEAIKYNLLKNEKTAIPYILNRLTFDGVPITKSSIHPELLIKSEEEVIRNYEPILIEIIKHLTNVRADELLREFGPIVSRLFPYVLNYETRTNLAKIPLPDSLLKAGSFEALLLEVLEKSLAKHHPTLKGTTLEKLSNHQLNRLDYAYLIGKSQHILALSIVKENRKNLASGRSVDAPITKAEFDRAMNTVAHELYYSSTPALLNYVDPSYYFNLRDSHGNPIWSGREIVAYAGVLAMMVYSLDQEKKEQALAKKVDLSDLQRLQGLLEEVQKQLSSQEIKQLPPNHRLLQQLKTSVREAVDQCSKSIAASKANIVEQMELNHAFSSLRSRFKDVLDWSQP